MIALVVLASALQGVVMLVDEGYFHRRRGLPRWERVGHPLDTLTVAVCYAWLVFAPRTAPVIPVYAALAIFSCLFVTKDEVVHARLCSRAECWLHALLFLLHPIVLASFGYAWMNGGAWLVPIQLGLTLVMGAWQIAYWSFLRRGVQA